MTRSFPKRCLIAFAAWSLSATASAAPRYRPVAVETRFKAEDSARIDRIEPELRRGAIDALGHRGIEVDETSNTTVVFQVLHVVDDNQSDGVVSNYGTHIEVLIDGEKVGEEITMCMQKGEAELLGCALSGLPKIVHLLPMEEETQPETVLEPDNVQDTNEQERRALRWTGVALGIAGAATLITGAVLRPQEETKRTLAGSSAGTETAPKYSPTTTGALIGAGAAVLGIGIGFIIADTIRSKRKKQSTALVAPALSPSSAALVLQARF